MVSFVTKCARSLVPYGVILLYRKMANEKISSAQQRWLEVEGDFTLRLDCPYLTENSVVFDVGGYRGNWAKDIFAKYLPNIYIFEPVKRYYDSMVSFFEKNGKIFLYNHGFGKENMELEISLNEDGSSVFLKSNQCENVNVVKASEFIDTNNITFIHLMKLNVEGG